MKRSVTKKVGRMNKERGRWFLITAVVVAGAVFFWWHYGRTDRGMRENLLSQARIMAGAVDIERVKALTGTEADLASSDYLRLKEQLALLREGAPHCRFVYLMGRKADGTVFFFADSEPAGSPDESSPGQVFGEISAELLAAFDNKIALVEGPVADRWGKWISAVAPLTDPKTSELIAVLGMDRDARFWKWEVAAEDPAPIGFLLIVMIGLVAALISSGRASASPKPVMRRLLPISIAVLLLLIGGGFWGAMSIQEDHIRSASLMIKKQAMGDIKQLLKEQARALETVQAVLLRNTELIAALKAGDRGRLLDLSDQLFDELNARYNITHFYFSDAERVCLLRVHNPEKYGDRFDRFTALEAESTGQVASGIELGPLGTFTLRVVRPVFEDGQLLGYLELGKEIEDVLSGIVKYEGVEKILAIRKDALDRARWEAGMAMLGRETDWDRLADSAVIFASIPFPDEAAGFLNGEEHGRDHTDTSHEIRFAEKVWHVMVEPVADVSGKDIGELLVLYDVTVLKAAQGKFFGLAGTSAGVVMVAFLALAFVMLRRTDESIRAQQRALHEVNDQYQSLVDNMLGIVYRCKCDKDWTMLFMSDEVDLLIGYPASDFVDNVVRTYESVIHPDQAAFVAESINKAVADGEPWNIEYRICRKDGDIRWVQEKGRGIIDENGRVDYLDGFILDITERKKAEEKFRESEELLSRTQEISKSGSWKLDLTENRLIWSDEVYCIFGYEPQAFEVTYEVFLDAVHPDDRAAVNEAFSRSLREGNDGYEIEHRIVRRNSGEVRHVHERCVHERDNSGAIIGSIGMAMDITARKEAEKKLKDAYRDEVKNRQLMASMLEDNNQVRETLEKNIKLVEETQAQLLQSEKMAAIGHLASGIAHEIKNPLATIILAIDSLDDLEQRDQKTNSRIDMMRRAAERANEVIVKLLGFSHVSDSEKRPMNLYESLDNVLLLAKNFTKFKNVELVKEYDHSSLTVMGDSILLEQVFMNLISNAVDAVDIQGKVIIRTECYEETMSGKKEVAVEVIDNGKGVPSEDLAKLFNPFFTTKDPGKGTGLGLSIAHMIINHHGGQIVAKSEIGHGTTFRVILPCAT